MKFRIMGLEERFVIREWLEKHGNNIRVVESIYQQEGRKEVTEKMERTTLVAILVLSTIYVGRKVHHMLSILSGPQVILTLMCQ